jgi:mono/diheme cytochrome c family protein
VGDRAGLELPHGALEDIVQLRRKLGVYDKSRDATSRNHNLSLWIGSQRTGRWMRRSPFENPYVLASELGRSLHNWKLAPTEQRDYAQAPEVRNLSGGEYLFRTRCAACHTIGEGDVSAPEQRRAGPDLVHVAQRRERGWLERWLAAPDQLLAEGDPIALALRAQYGEIAMPNMRLTPTEIAQLAFSSAIASIASVPFDCSAHTRAVGSWTPNGFTPLNVLFARPSQKFAKLNTALIMVGVLRGSTRRTVVPFTLKIGSYRRVP